MLSRENKVIGGFVLLALVVSYGGFVLTDLPDELLVGTVIAIGVVAPMLVNGYLDGDDAG